MCIKERQLIGWSEQVVADAQVAEDQNKFMKVALSKGGVEGWLQGELVIIFQSLPGDVAVLREQHIYEDRKKSVDFEIRSTGGKKTFVEVKVESLFQSAGDGHRTIDHDMWKKVQNDYEKLRDQRKEDEAEQPAFVLAITWSPEATAGLKNWLDKGGFAYSMDVLRVTETSPYDVSFFVMKVS